MPAMADPTRFLAVFSSQMASTVVLSTVETMAPGIVASTTTEHPRPSILRREGGQARASQQAGVWVNEKGA